MRWYEKIKEGARGILKEHPVSIVVFLLSCVLAGIKGDYPEVFGKGTASYVAEFIYRLLLSITPVFVLCESNYAYKKKIGKISSLKEVNKSLVYGIVSAIGLVISCIYAYLYSALYREIKVKGSQAYLFKDYFDRVFYVYLAVCVFSALFFMYKKYGETFEKYALRAFLGLMKAELVYGIILLGTFCILWVFGELFFDLDIQSVILWLVTGIVGFPATLVALSFTGKETSKFSNVVMGYVFPGILAAAFLIVYAYIIKILVTWTFPSNQVFTIATALFASGLAFWTMAQGCTEGKIYTALRVMPLFFIPFIVIQIMCLSMRINQYGITGSRYLGILMIVFEILYEVYYILRFIRKEGLGGILMPLLLLFTFIYFLVPGINVYATITKSQKAVVDRVVNAAINGSETQSAELAKARSAYREIVDNGGLEGRHYLEKLYAASSKEKVEDILGTRTYTSEDESVLDRSYYVYVDHQRGELDVEGYSHVCYVVGNFNADEPDLEALPITNYIDSTSLSLELDISDVVHKLKEMELDESGELQKREAISDPIKTDKGVFYIENINFGFDENDEENEVRDLTIEGYYIYN